MSLEICLHSHVKHIKAFSDNCGGQNKSHLISKFCLYVVHNTHIITVEHQYFVGGHSYSECDQDFGIIEIHKKKNQKDMYIPQDWVHLVATASRKFIVTVMTNDYKSRSPEQIFPEKCGRYPRESIAALPERQSDQTLV